MKRFFLLILLCYLTADAYAQKKSVSIPTELEKLANIQALPVYWEDTKVIQISSYDTTGLNNDGFSGKYSFIRKTADSSLVIFEEQGNGVINRIWTPTPTEDTLDFYFGGEDQPSYSIRFSDLFTGDVYPFVPPLTGNEIGGYFCYFPIPFKNGCKIVFRGDKLEFYQIQHRAYPKNYHVENFSQRQAEASRPAIEALARQWESIGEPDKGRTLSADTVLTPGQTLTLAKINQGGRILGIELQPAKAFTGLNKQIDLKITWDDEDEPAIFIPVADFFGYAFGNISMQSLLLGTEDNTNYCYFPMPFDHNATIELVYRSPVPPARGEAIGIKSTVYFSDEERDTKKEGKFYAYWNRNIDAPIGKPHVFLAGAGKGHYVGTILQCQGLNPGMTIFFEGDDITTIDGEMRMHGTGSEDYFNGGWYALLDRWDRKMSLSLHGSLDYSLPYARTGGYRLFISDKMPFDKEILHTMEHGPEHNNVPVDYTSVALYYSGEPVARQQDAPANPITSVYIPDTFMIYPQLMRYSFAGTFKVEGNVLQSNGGQVRIDLSELPKGHYKLYADMEKTPEGAEVRVWQRQTPVSNPISFYASEKTTKPKEYLCDIDINDFKETITLHFKRDEKKSKIHINRLILIRNKNVKTQ